jgi:hypothetical protein
MNRFVMMCLLAGAGYLMWNHLGASGPAAQVDDQHVALETADFNVRFSRLEPFSEAYMIFGGSDAQPRNMMTHVTLSGLPVRHARSIAQSYPDFHRCKSPGARQAQQLTKTMNFVAADRQIQKTLSEALKLFNKRVGLGPDGDRTCVTVSGERLELESVHLKQNGMDITSDVAPTLKMKVYLASDAEVADCKTLLN